MEFKDASQPTSRWEDYSGLWGGPNVITSVLTSARGRQEGQNHRDGSVPTTQGDMGSFEHGGRGHQAKNAGSL